MVATVTSNHKFLSPNPKRMPLLPSETDNGTLRRPKAREVTSRYLSIPVSSSSNSSSSSSSNNTASSSNTTGSLPAISSKRYNSPVVSRVGVTTPRNSQRAMSVGRRLPVAVEATPSNAERMLVKSMRSLSVSFQGESISVPVSKAKTPSTAVGVGTPGGGLRKGTPERRKLTPVRDRRERENSRPSDQQQQHLWPGRSRRDTPISLTRSLDYSAQRNRSSGSEYATKELRKSIIDENSISRNKIGIKTQPDSYNSEAKRTNKMEFGPHLSISVNSDTTTVSSKSIETRSVSQFRGGGQKQIVVPARVWQDSNRMHRVPNTPSPRSIASGLNITGPSKLSGAKKLVDENPTVSFVSGKLGQCRTVDAHDLRLLYNRQLQWRFVNARAEKAQLGQKETAERSLYNAWISTTKLRHSVKVKRIELQFLRNNLKLYSILKGQELYLENWDLMDVDHNSAVSSAKEALEASIIRLPVVGGAKANVQHVEEAISSAVDVMQDMASSICSLLSEVEHMSFLVSELAKFSAREYSSLDEYRDLLSTRFLPLQGLYCSLRIHLLQTQHVRSSLPEKV